ncbi:MAG: glycosyltransferase [Nitrospinota bacterium]
MLPVVQIRAVISISCGAKGIEAENGRDLLLADEPREFARRTLELLKEPGKAKGLSRAGRSLVLFRYQWRQSAGRLRAIMEEALSERQRGSAPRRVR